MKLLQNWPSLQRIILQPNHSTWNLRLNGLLLNLKSLREKRNKINNKWIAILFLYIL